MTLLSPDYITRDQHGIKEVRCKICSTPIRNMVPHDTPRETRVIGDKTIVHHHMVLGTNANYREVTLLVKDEEGHRNNHVTPLCATCLEKYKGDLKVLEEVYQADISELAIGEGLGQLATRAWRKMHVIGVK